MITFDEWPTSSFVGADGKIDRTLFPNIAAFADSATWYRNATSVTSATWHAVPAILIGEVPEGRPDPGSVVASGEPVHVPRWQLPPRRLGVGDASVPALVVQRAPGDDDRTCGRDRARRRRGDDVSQDGLAAWRDRRRDARASRRSKPSTAVKEAANATGPGDHADIDLGAGHREPSAALRPVPLGHSRRRGTDAALPAHPVAARRVPLSPERARVQLPRSRLRQGR